MSVDIRCPPLPVGRSGSVLRVWPLTLSLPIPRGAVDGPRSRQECRGRREQYVGTGYVKQIKRAVETRPSVRNKIIIIIIIIIAKTDNARQENVDSIIILLLRFACVESRVLRRSDLCAPRRWNSTADGDLRCFFFFRFHSFVHAFVLYYVFDVFSYSEYVSFFAGNRWKTRLWSITSRFMTIIAFCQDFAPNDDVSRCLL